MAKIYIFGDSFFNSEPYFDQATRPWTTQLASKFSVINEADRGLSNHEIYLKFLKYIHSFTPSDVIILGWSDPSRFYLNPGIQRTESMYKMHYKNFYNNELETLYQKTFMNEVKSVVKEKNLRLLVLWSFPSGYAGTTRQNPNWLDTFMFNINPEQYQYADTFDNEVRPALIYISRKEASLFETAQAVVNYFLKDIRPNHIKDQTVHNELVKIVTEFVETRISGQVDLIKRLENGS